MDELGCAATSDDWPQRWRICGGLPCRGILVERGAPPGGRSSPPRAGAAARFDAGDKTSRKPGQAIAERQPLARGGEQPICLCRIGTDGGDRIAAAAASREWRGFTTLTNLSCFPFFHDGAGSGSVHGDGQKNQP